MMMSVRFYSPDVSQTCVKEVGGGRSGPGWSQTFSGNFDIEPRFLRRSLIPYKHSVPTSQRTLTLRIAKDTGQGCLEK